MSKPSWIVLFVSLAFAASLVGEEGAPSFYLIGNSLTQDTVPSKLDGDVQWHIDCGKSLPYIFENPGEPCVKTSALWPEALKEKQYRFVSVQVHYGSKLDSDAAVISQYLEMQTKAVFVIHSGWARSESLRAEYAGKAESGAMEHSPAYLEKLIATLRKAHPDREIRESRTQDLLARIAEDIDAGKAPFGHIGDLYRDAIHMDRVAGRYLAHNAMRHAFGQQRSVAGFEEILSPVKKYLDGILDTLPSHEEARQ